jgi:hypothetical protein
MPISWCLATPKLGEREVAAALLDDAARQHALAEGTIILADKGFAGRDFHHHLRELGAWLVRPDRKDEPRRFGSLGGMRQWIERVFDTSRTNSVWNSIVAAPWAGCSSASASGCWPWLRSSGSTGSSESPRSAPCSPMTTRPPHHPIGISHLDVDSKDLLQVATATTSSQSRHSARTARIHRSA